MQKFNKSAVRILIMALAICCSVLSVNAQEHFKRGLEQITFVPKGQWITGVSVNYSHSNQDNYQFLIV